MVLMPRRVVPVVGALLFLFPISVRDRYSTEARAVQVIRTIHAAQSQYYSQRGRWAGSLDELRSLLPDELISGRAYGYRFRMRATTTSYGIQADPLAGRDRSIDSDQTMIVRTSNGNPIR
jgi:hypothetical protein